MWCHTWWHKPAELRKNMHHRGRLSVTFQEGIFFRQNNMAYTVYHVELMLFGMLLFLLLYRSPMLSEFTPGFMFVPI